MAKMGNVLNGYLNKFDIEEITIFDYDYDVVYSGNLENFENAADGQLAQYRDSFKNSEIERCTVFNRRKLFFFLKE